jgi:MFS family permease
MRRIIIVDNRNETLATSPPTMKAAVDLTSPVILQGVRSNLPQIVLLVAVNAFVGTVIGVERTVLPLLGKAAFGLEKVIVITSFIVSFGITKAFTNLFAGRLADRFGRKRVLVAGWAVALPVPLIVMFAPSWGWVVFANALLAVNQGLCWTLTLLMKIDLGGPRRRGFAAGINETIGYGFVSLAGLAATEIAARYGLRPYPYLIALAAAAFGFLAALVLVRDTNGHMQKEHEDSKEGAAPAWRDVFARVSFRDRSILAAVQAGAVRNMADGMAWGLLLLLFASALGQRDAGTLQWIMVACFALGQILFGSLSDVLGRKVFIIVGMTLVGLSLELIGGTEGFTPWTIGVVLLGVGGSLMYPTVIGSLSDQMGSRWRATGLGVYRFWRDLGYAIGALASGAIADRFGMKSAVHVIGAVAFASALVTALFLRETPQTGAREGIEDLGVPSQNTK